jgi:hypothetical protein
VPPQPSKDPAGVCRRCGEPMGWPAPCGVVYGDGTAEHHDCRFSGERP